MPQRQDGGDADIGSLIGDCDDPCRILYIVRQSWTTGRCFCETVPVAFCGYAAFDTVSRLRRQHLALDALAALAFVLSILADFTALPAALWILVHARPDVDEAESVRTL